MEKLIKQGSEILNNTPAQTVGALTAGGSLMWVEYMDLWLKVGSGVYITLMIISISTKLYRDWKKR